MATKLEIGTILPAFSLSSQHGLNRSLPDTAGANLLVFYRGDW